MTSTEQQRVEEVAAGLSRAQREALLRAELDGNLGRYFSRFINVSAGRDLVRARLATAVWSGVMLTPLGLRVRAHLQEQAS